MKKLNLTIISLILSSCTLGSVSATNNEALVTTNDEKGVVTTIKKDEKNGLVTKTQEFKEDTVAKVLSITLDTKKEDYEVEIAFKLIAKCLERSKILGNDVLIKNVNVTSEENSNKKVISFEVTAPKNKEDQLNSYIESVVGETAYKADKIKSVLKNAIEKNYDKSFLNNFVKEYKNEIDNKIENIRDKQKLENLNIFNLFNLGSLFSEDKEEREIRDKIEEYKINKLKQTERNLKNLDYEIDKKYLKNVIDSINSITVSGTVEKQGSSYFSSTTKE